MLLEVLRGNSYNCAVFYAIGGFSSCEKLLSALFLPDSNLQESPGVTPKKLFSKTQEFSSAKSEFMIKRMKLDETPE